MASVALLGDVVGSRLVSDRQRLHDEVSAVLASVSEQHNAPLPITITTGDEFQGTYSRLGDALAISLVIRMRLEPQVGVRFGIGRGDVTVLDSGTGAQDGPGWWAARAAIDHVQSKQDAVGWAGLRTAYRERGAPGNGSEGGTELSPTELSVNAALVCQDLLLDSFDERTWTILRGVHEGMTQQDIADQIGISRQAVQQRRASSGIPMLLAAASALASLP